MSNTIDPSSGIGFDPSQTTAIVCKCGNHTFIHASLLRHVSAVVSPTGKEGIIPIPTLVCNACGFIPKEILPSFLKNDAVAKIPTLTLTK